VSYRPEPFPLDPRRGVRRVYLSGHQRSYAAYFIGWTRDEAGRLQAVVELEDGSVFMEWLIVGLTFVDGVEP